jgi:prepilin-type N-terminal cleavage/methylation domain-containing protein
MNNKSAFTLLEIVITVVILSFLISMALPRYLITLEKTKTAEAMNILTALKDAQILYKYENGAYTATPGDLDVTIPTPANFNDPTVATADPIASIQRKTGAPYDYTLTIDANGAIKCAEVSPAGICVNVGCSGVGGLCN